MPHVTEQLDHAPYAAHTQSYVQQPSLQDRVCSNSVAEHVPPHDGCVMLRVRDCEPPLPPQEAEQADQADQLPTTQLVGQQPASQERDSVKLALSGHEPPLASGTAMERDRDSMPGPHEVEHIQADHEDT